MLSGGVLLMYNVTSVQSDAFIRAVIGNSAVFSPHSGAGNNIGVYKIGIQHNVSGIRLALLNSLGLGFSFDLAVARDLGAVSRRADHSYGNCGKYSKYSRYDRYCS